MSRGYRLIIAATGLAALVCAAGFGAFWGALYAPHYSYYAETPAYRTAYTEQHSPSQIDRDRAGLPYFAERIESGTDPTDSDDREKRDLAAQESMSVWAFWMMVVSAVGVVTTMVGTFFLLWQIILTRQAVEDTGKATTAMHDQNAIARGVDRPWMDITSEIELYRLFEGSTVQFRIRITATNIGRMAAEHAQFAFRTMAAPKFIAELDRQIADMREETVLRNFSRAIIPGKEQRNTVDMSFPITGHSVYGKNSPRMRIIILAFYRYKIPGEIDFRESITAWMVKRIRPKSLLPPGTVLAPNIGILVSEMPALTEKDLDLVRVRVEAT